MFLQQSVCLSVCPSLYCPSAVHPLTHISRDAMYLSEGISMKLVTNKLNHFVTENC